MSKNNRDYVLVYRIDALLGLELELELKKARKACNIIRFYNTFKVMDV
jgi:hypothetical protein